MSFMSTVDFNAPWEDPSGKSALSCDDQVSAKAQLYTHALHGGTTKTNIDFTKTKT